MVRARFLEPFKMVDIEIRHTNGSVKDTAQNSIGNKQLTSHKLIHYKVAVTEPRSYFIHYLMPDFYSLLYSSLDTYFARPCC